MTEDDTQHDLFDKITDEISFHNQSPNLRKIASGMKADPYRWVDATSLPTRPWILEDWLLAGEVTLLIGAGGIGKSAIINALALSLVSGKPLLGKEPSRGKEAVWIYNLEDDLTELERQIAAACIYHGIEREDCADRLYLNSGLDQSLCTAIDIGDQLQLDEAVFEQITMQIIKRNIAALFVDPFVSSHSIRENSNESNDRNIKRWKRVAQDSGCAIFVAHHTKKLGPLEASDESGRGAIALRDAARIVLPLNRFSVSKAKEYGFLDPGKDDSLVRIETGKSNRSRAGCETIVRLLGQSLNNGGSDGTADIVGVATLYELSDGYYNLSDQELANILNRVAASRYRGSSQAKDWIGNLIASETGLNVKRDRKLLKKIIQDLIDQNMLKVERQHDEKGTVRPFIVVGEVAAQLDSLQSHHCVKVGEEGVESGGFAA